MIAAQWRNPRKKVV
uniref:Uncharacterized protein n=1 Tax=Arundo donax TaxID=35708 RepID=A0A0A9BZZ0_ARUDO